MERRPLESLWTRLRNLLVSLWDWVVDAGLTFWIVRVSLLSVLIGCVLFIFVPQVRDTFLEVRGSDPTKVDNIANWVLFFFLAILLWALPVHYAARRNLRHDRLRRGHHDLPAHRSARLEWLET
jgi:hypothetical protein